MFIQRTTMDPVPQSVKVLTTRTGSALVLQVRDWAMLLADYDWKWECTGRDCAQVICTDMGLPRFLATIRSRACREEGDEAAPGTVVWDTHLRSFHSTAVTIWSRYTAMASLQGQKEPAALDEPEIHCWNMSPRIPLTDRSLAFWSMQKF